MDERKEFIEWAKKVRVWDIDPPEAVLQAWQAATLAERERAAKVVETQDTCGDYVGGWFSLLAEKIRKG